jgi:hypothetical protein
MHIFEIFAQLDALPAEAGTPYSSVCPSLSVAPLSNLCFRNSFQFEDETPFFGLLTEFTFP